MQPVRGFTLIELIVTIAILAIIATLAAPSFSNIIQRQQLNAATESLVNMLEEAHTQAILKHTEISVSLSNDNTKNYVWKSPNKTSIDAPSVDPITFNSSGFSTSDITINLRNDNQTKSVVITLIGNVNISN